MRYLVLTSDHVTDIPTQTTTPIIRTHFTITGTERDTVFDPLKKSRNSNQKEFYQVLFCWIGITVKSVYLFQRERGGLFKVHIRDSSRSLNPLFATALLVLTRQLPILSLLCEHASFYHHSWCVCHFWFYQKWTFTLQRFCTSKVMFLLPWEWPELTQDLFKNNQRPAFCITDLLYFQFVPLSTLELYKKWASWCLLAEVVHTYY